MLVLCGMLVLRAVCVCVCVCARARALVLCARVSHFKICQACSLCVCVCVLVVVMLCASDRAVRVIVP